jgi:hypothetical protein
VYISTPGEISFPEAFFTLSMYLIMILSLYVIDAFKNLRKSQYYDKLLLGGDYYELSQELSYTQYEALYHLQ